MRQSRFAHPASAFMRAAARFDALAIARAVACEDLLELGPVDRTEAIVLALFVPAQVRVRHAQTEELRLRHGDVDELLPQLVVGETLDLPAHRLRSVLRVRVVRSEH